MRYLRLFRVKTFFFVTDIQSWHEISAEWNYQFICQESKTQPEGQNIIRDVIFAYKIERLLLTFAGTQTDECTVNFSDPTRPNISKF